ncbi:hypothetical protein Hanom_Chr13g01195881 [Helianthus anomalus]
MNEYVYIGVKEEGSNTKKSEGSQDGGEILHLGDWTAWNVHT